INRQAQMDKTKGEVQQLVTKAKQEIAAEKVKAMKQAEKELGSIAVTIAEKLVKRELTDTDHARLVSETLKEIGTV
ncbi:MAG: ATP synthase F0 subunit B, partial [Patescibacteria group bacterium]